MYAYDDAKGKSFSSFARICVQSQMISYVMAMTADKNKILNEAVSLSSSDEEGEEPLLERLPGPSKDPESKVIAKESYAELWEEAKETLSSFELQIFPFYLRGYTSGQIADLLHMNAKSVDNGIQRIRRKIIIEA